MGKFIYNNAFNSRTANPRVIGLDFSAILTKDNCHRKLIGKHTLITRTLKLANTDPYSTAAVKKWGIYCSEKDTEVKIEWTLGNQVRFSAKLLSKRLCSNPNFGGAQRRVVLYATMGNNRLTVKDIRKEIKKVEPSTTKLLTTPKTLDGFRDLPIRTVKPKKLSLWERLKNFWRDWIRFKRGD